MAICLFCFTLHCIVSRLLQEFWIPPFVWNIFGNNCKTVGWANICVRWSPIEAINDPECSSLSDHQLQPSSLQTERRRSLQRSQYHQVSSCRAQYNGIVNLQQDLKSNPRGHSCVKTLYWRVGQHLQFLRCFPRNIANIVLKIDAVHKVLVDGWIYFLPLYIKWKTNNMKISSICSFQIWFILFQFSQCTIHEVKRIYLIKQLGKIFDTFTTLN